MSRRAGRRQSGFTLLEILVAAAIMGLAVAGVMSGLSTSARNAARIGEYDRAAMLARTKMDELLLDTSAPRNRFFGGPFPPIETGGVAAGWQARVVPFEAVGTEFVPGVVAIERVELEIWWMDGATRRAFTLEGIRRAEILAEGAR